MPRTPLAHAHDMEALLGRLSPEGSHFLRVALSYEAKPSSSLLLGWPGLDEVLPDGGLPKGVVELTAPGALGGSTSIALAAVRAAQTRSPNGWCAWLDPDGTLYAPGVAAAGVDLRRMLVVRSSRALLGRMAVKVVGAGAFDVVVVDLDPVPRAAPCEPASAGRTRRKAWAPEVLVRKLALAAEPNGVTVLLLSDSTRPRAVVWPVALRLELERPSFDEMAVRVAKDKRGRAGLAKTVPFAPLSCTLRRVV